MKFRQKKKLHEIKKLTTTYVYSVYIVKRRLEMKLFQKTKWNVP